MKPSAAYCIAVIPVENGRVSGNVSVSAVAVVVSSVEFSILSCMHGIEGDISSDQCKVQLFIMHAVEGGSSSE